jgi:5-methyltetrahydrofolate--homocysteine methyltransferase
MTTAEKRARHQRFWQPLEKGEGGYLSVTAPLAASGAAPATVPALRDLAEQWLSPAYQVLKAEAMLQNTFFGEDSIPSVFVNLGPGVQAALLGAPYLLRPDSVWFGLEPPLKDWNSIPVFKTDQEHELYKAVDGITRALCEISHERFAVSFTDIGGQYDVLYSLRGDSLLTDFIEYPDEIAEAERRLDEEFLRYFFELRDIIAPTGCGYSNWIPVLSDEPWYPFQCDLSVMISPAMFERFVLPSLDKVSTAIGRGIYHLDGPGEIHHLDMILSLKNISAVQWVPLPKQHTGKAGVVMRQDYADEMSLGVYRRCLAAGKKVVLLNIEPKQVEPIFNAVGSDGVFIFTSCQAQKEAEALIASAHQQKWIT